MWLVTEWSGECVPCEFVNGGLVVLVVSLSWAYVLVTHKLSQQPFGRALPLTLVYVSAAHRRWTRH